MSKLTDELKDANRRGVSPPQNWTHRAIDYITELQQQIEDLQEKLLWEQQKQNEGYKVPALEQQLEDMKCCSNCLHRNDDYDCYLSTHWFDGNKICKDKDAWQSDSLTRKEREA